MSDTNNRVQNPPLAARGAILRLGLLALGAVLLLTLAYHATAARRIAQQHQAMLATLTTLLPPIPHDNVLLDASFIIDPATPRFAQQELLGLSTARTAYLARSADAVSGVILPLETAGYNGPLKLLLGIDANGTITGLRILEQHETAGLGARIELDQSNWLLSFDRRSLDNTPPPLWALKQDGGEFDQFSGATITPRAIVNAVRKALEFFALNRTALLALNLEEPQA
ncbi:MAG: RnfABCDGE type electron transport complex subunit G [Pseudomonadales bacterium]|jgi:electron transport complex protein RnfG|nr:RnfABCDGE type electron transport complex subunit G [Pseudomonadales bacterium]